MTDNEKYMALMGKYKDLRGSKPSDANRYLKAAMQVRKSGKVDEDVIIGSTYL